jgi:hypothetical protein
MLRNLSLASVALLTRPFRMWGQWCGGNLASHARPVIRPGAADPG